MSEFNQTQTIDEATLQRRAFRTAVQAFIALCLASLLYLYLAWQSSAWQLYVLFGVTAANTIAALVSMRLIRQGRSITGTWIIISISYVILPTVVLLVEGLGLISGIFISLASPLIVSQSLPRKQTRIATAIGIGIGILLALTDLLPLDYRLSVPAIQAIVPILGVATFLGTGFFVIRRAWQGNLRIKLTVFFVLGAVSPLLVVGALVGYQIRENQLDQVLALENQVSKRVAEQVENFIFAREAEIRSLTDVRGFTSLPLEEQEALLSNLLSSQNLYDELILVDNTGQEQIYLSRVEILTPEDLGSRAGAEEFEQPKATGETYYGPVTFDEQTGEPHMKIAVPIFDLRSGEQDYVLIANFRFKPIWDLMAQADVVGSGIVYMINEDNQVVAHKNPSMVLQGTQVELPIQDGYTQGLDGTEVAMAQTPVTFNEQTFYVIAELPRSEALRPAINTLIIIGVVIGLTVLGSIIFGVFMARLITDPIRSLASAAHAVSEGDLSQEIEITTRDEIGDLARVFDTMTAQLREMIRSLEQRIADRTRALEISTEVSRSLSTILEQDQLVREVVEQLRSAFGYYHAHIYFFDENKQNLVMAGGTGDAGRTMLARGHKIEPGRGLVGRAAQNNQVILIPDVAQAEGWLPNPLLPDTKAEVAVPIAIGDDVLGVLDVQHNVTNGLSEQDADLIQAIGNQVAIAVQNAQAYTEAQRQAMREARITSINQRIQTANTIEDVLKIAVSELGQTLEADRADIELSMVQKSNGGSSAS